jgi:hypothetical protein
MRSRKSGPVRVLGATVVLVALVGGQVAAAVVFTVNSGGDASDFTIDGVCETAPGNQVCTLRAAVDEANASGDPNRRVALPALTVTLTQGFVLISQPLTIEGVGRGASVLQAPPGARQAGLKVLADVVLRDLTMRGFGGGSFGAIDARANLTAERSDFVDNDVTPSGGGGGAISQSLLPPVRSLTLTDCEFRQNAAAYGGAIFLGYASARVERSTFTDNLATLGGGGAFFASPVATTLTMLDSTLVGNRSDDDGGAILVDATGGVGPEVRIYSSSFLGNDSDADLNGSGAGGAFLNRAPPSNVQLANSIFADNGESTFLFHFYIRIAQECRGGATSNGHNIVLFDDGSCAIAGAVTAADPLLEPLAFHGGPTETLAIAAWSPAIDAGNPATAGGCYDDLGAPIATDQRGAVRPYGAECDLGAFEWGTLIFSDDFEAGSLLRWAATVGM